MQFTTSLVKGKKKQLTYIHAEKLSPNGLTFMYCGEKF